MVQVKNKKIIKIGNTNTHTHTHTFNGPFSGTTQMSPYQKGKTSLDFTEARDSEWQWHQLGNMQVCTLLQTDNHTSTPPLSFLQAGCPSCRPTNSIKALKATALETIGNRNTNNIKTVIKNVILCGGKICNRCTLLKYAAMHIRIKVTSLNDTITTDYD